MFSQTVSNDDRFVRKSILCIEKILEKLDSEAGITGALSVKQSYTVHDVIAKPKCVLDSLALYLRLIHSLDWYSVMGEGGIVMGSGEEKITVRPDPGVAVMCKEEEVDFALEQLVSRTEHFLQVT